MKTTNMKNKSKFDFLKPNNNSNNKLFKDYLTISYHKLLLA